MTLLRLIRALTNTLRPGELDAFAGEGNDDVVGTLKGKME